MGWVYGFLGSERVAISDTNRALRVMDVELSETLTGVLAALTPVAAAHNGGSAVSVSNASTLIAAANAGRRRLSITNRSLTAMLTLNYGGTAVSGAGDCLAPAADAVHPGGSIVITDYSGVVNGIMSAADATAGNVAVVEI